MKTFEHKIVILHGPTAKADEEILAELASEGWELVTATERRAYLKRDNTPAAGQPMSKLDGPSVYTNPETSTTVDETATPFDQSTHANRPKFDKKRR